MDGGRNARPRRSRSQTLLPDLVSACPRRHAASRRPTPRQRRTPRCRGGRRPPSRGRRPRRAVLGGRPAPPQDRLGPDLGGAGQRGGSRGPDGGDARVGPPAARDPRAPPDDRRRWVIHSLTSTIYTWPSLYASIPPARCLFSERTTRMHPPSRAPRVRALIAVI